MQFGPVPNEIRGCQHFMKLAEDHDDRNIIISYYARMAAIQLAMKIVPGSKPPEVSKYLMQIMDYLEKTKQEKSEVEGITNETVAQALIEEYMIKLYEYAYKNDCQSSFQKNMVKSYYTASLLCEVLTQFGPLSEDISNKCKTAKYRAAYIHNMLKNGQEPTPINVTIIENEDDESEFSLTEEEVNKRREMRGEDPLTPSDPRTSSMTPEEYAEQQKTVDEFSTKTKEEMQEELRRIKERIDSEPSENMYDKQPITPERIIDVGPPIPDRIAEPAALPARSPGSDIFESTSVATLLPAQNDKAMKYCKWASSALNYDDTKTAIDNLEKALYLCKFGKEKD